MTDDEAREAVESFKRAMPIFPKGAFKLLGWMVEEAITNRRARDAAKVGADG